MDIQSLSTSERILLAEQLWDSVRGNASEIEVTPAQKRILESRLKADSKPGDTWESVKKRIISQ